MDDRVQHIARYFAQLAPADLAALDTVYTAEAQFKDPFNEVVGVAAIRRVFEHMFANLEQPRFVIAAAVVQGDQCFMTWDFRFRMKRYDSREQCIRGASYLLLAADGRIAIHRDYWDAAEELYEKLPLLGALMRWLKRRVGS
jgi:ketosteroid isomerase-like protein